MVSNYNNLYPADGSTFDICQQKAYEDGTTALQDLNSLATDHELSTVFDELPDNGHGSDDFCHMFKTEDTFQAPTGREILPDSKFHQIEVDEKSSISPISPFGVENNTQQIYSKQKTETSKEKAQSDHNAEVDLQAKKKAQNRAAQRAFRERKEAKLRELEQKLQMSERDKESLLKEIKELKKQNLDILTKTSRSIEPGSSYRSSHIKSRANAKFTFPNEQEFFTNVVSDKHSTDPIPQRFIYKDDKGKKVLTVSATWEYLHNMSHQVEFDVDMVLTRLRGREICHGHGPAYNKELIDAILDECAL